LKFFGLILIIFLSLFPEVDSTGIKNQIKTSAVKNPPVLDFKPGDILLIHIPDYDGTIWNIAYWSHSYLYLGSDIFINACGKGVMCTNSSKLWGVSAYSITNYAQLRVNGNFDVNKVINFTKSKIGLPFDYLSLFLITKQVNPTKGDFGYGYYCSELPWAAYIYGANINLDSNRIGWVTPWNLYVSKHVTKIYVYDPNIIIPPRTRVFSELFNL